MSLTSRVLDDFAAGHTERVAAACRPLDKQGWADLVAAIPAAVLAAPETRGPTAITFLSGLQPPEALPADRADAVVPGLSDLPDAHRTPLAVEILRLFGAPEAVSRTGTGWHEAVLYLGSPLQTLQQWGTAALVDAIRALDSGTPLPAWLAPYDRTVYAHQVEKTLAKPPANSRVDEYVPWQELQQVEGGEWVGLRRFILDRARGDNRAGRLFQHRKDPLAEAALRELRPLTEGVPRLQILAALWHQAADESVLGPLEAAIEGDDPDLREAGLIAAQRVPHPRLARLADALLDHPDGRVRGTAFKTRFEQADLRNRHLATGSYSKTLDHLLGDDEALVRAAREDVRSAAPLR